MTEHIKNRIEEIIFGGGFVNQKLSKFIKVLSEIRHPRSIHNEFTQAFKDIESRKGTILEDHKLHSFKEIDKVWEQYPTNERELFYKGHTTSVVNGIKTTTTLRYK